VEWGGLITDGGGDHGVRMQLHLQNTGMSGTLPAEFAELRSIEIVRISSTALSGTLPPSFDRVPNLSYLDAHETLFEGDCSQFVVHTADLTGVSLREQTLRVLFWSRD
jgi:hypothetical protein